MNGLSLCCFGLAGVGKSTLVLGWAERLNQKNTVHLLSQTHVASQNLRFEGGTPMTLQRFINRHVKHGNLTGDMTIVLDECCQAGLGTWHEILAVSRLPKVQWLVMGDPNQFKAINQTWGGTLLETSVEETAMLKELVGGYAPNASRRKALGYHTVRFLFKFGSPRSPL